MVLIGLVDGLGCYLLVDFEVCVVLIDCFVLVVVGLVVDY